MELKKDQSMELKQAIELNQESFRAEMKKDMDRLPKREVFIIVHGFMNSFQSSVEIAACLASSLQFDGPMIAYSWPSGNALTEYLKAETNVDITVPHFKRFLLFLAQEIQPDIIHLFAQSMGNRVLGNALKELYLAQNTRLPLGQVIFNAADVDADVFKKTIFPTIQNKALRYTVYVAKWDLPLSLSSFLHAYPRLGMVDKKSQKPYLILEGLDTIDATEMQGDFLGHFYYRQHAAMAEDISQLLQNNTSPSQRTTPLFKEKDDKGTYWKLLDSKTRVWDKFLKKDILKLYYATDRAAK